MQDFKKKTKDIQKCVLFLMILFIILIGLSQTLTSIARKNIQFVQNRNKTIIGIQNESKNTIDVLVLGDSESYTAISPMELWNNQKITSYVCGQPGQRIQETYHLLKTALKTQSPKLVILETNVLFRTKKQAKDIQESVYQAGNYYLPVFQFHDLWKSFLCGKEYPKQYEKGFSIREEAQSYDGGEYMIKTKKKRKITEITKIYMKSIMKLCEENNASLLLVSVPSPMNYNYYKHNALKDYAKENSLNYLNLNFKTKELQINWKTDSADKGDHLNLSGANKVTSYLGKYIQDQYHLPTYTQGELYKNWEEEVKKYSEKIKESLRLMKGKDVIMKI